MAKSTKKDSKVGILHPWEITAKQLQKLLGADPEVTVIINKDEMSADVITGNTSKANAIFDLLLNEPMTWEDGAKLVFKVNGVAKTYETTCKLKDYERAFQDNMYFSRTEKDRGSIYVFWRPIPVQVSVVNLQDPNGFVHIMPANLAQLVFQSEFAHATEPLKIGVVSDFV